MFVFNFIQKNKYLKEYFSVANWWNYDWKRSFNKALDIYWNCWKEKLGYFFKRKIWYY